MFVAGRIPATVVQLAPWAPGQPWDTRTPCGPTLCDGGGNQAGERQQVQWVKKTWGARAEERQ